MVYLCKLNIFENYKLLISEITFIYLLILLCALFALLIIFFASSLVEHFSASTFKFFSLFNCFEIFIQV